MLSGGRRSDVHSDFRLFYVRCAIAPSPHVDSSLLLPPSSPLTLCKTLAESQDPGAASRDSHARDQLDLSICMILAPTVARHVSQIHPKLIQKLCRMPCLRGDSPQSYQESQSKRRKLSSQAFDRQPNMASYRDAKIQLDTVETQLRTLLLDAAAHSDTDTSDSVPTVLRFTGGWVRDKLLQQSSHDIDVSVSNMTGAQFSQRLQTFLDTTPDSAKKYGNVAFHTIAANPDKSKHLETVTTRILGLDIDFVNLRKETYSEDSRNPQMEFGTPEEDALRRDATVNALFYNISTDTVEDFTTKGLDDMQAKIIRTPLDPYQTFMDDPLRVLRLIRFASRLGFELDGPVQQAMKDQSIQDALRKKISRERVEIELSKMLRGHDPHLAIALIHRAGLYDTIFCDPEHPTEGDMAPYSTELLSIANQLRALLDNGEQPPTSLLVRSQDDRYLSWILACLVPYRDAVEDIKPGSGKAPTPKATIVVRDGLKSTRNICALVTSAVRNRSSITAKVNARQSRTARDDLGMAIRGWGATWRLQIMYTLLADIADEPGLKDGRHIHLFTTCH